MALYWYSYSAAPAEAPHSTSSSVPFCAVLDTEMVCGCAGRIVTVGVAVEAWGWPTPARLEARTWNS